MQNIDTPTNVKMFCPTSILNKMMNFAIFLVVRLSDNILEEKRCSTNCIHPHKCYPSCTSNCCNPPLRQPSVLQRPTQLMRYTGMRPVYPMSYPAQVLYNYQYARSIPCWPGCSPICYPQCTYACCLMARGKK